MTLRDAGMEVVYTGLHQSITAIVQAAIQEDVDVIGLSMLSGAHVPLVRKLMAALQEAGVADMAVVAGGTIPPDDMSTLQALGVQAVFPVGTPLSRISSEIETLLENRRGQRRLRRYDAGRNKSRAR
jgi:methylmalonyl-CoA mutase C-terminal domain/subunit